MSTQIKTEREKNDAHLLGRENDPTVVDTQKPLITISELDKKANPLALFQPSAADIKTNDGSIKAIGLTIIFVVFVLFGGWSVLAPIDSAALASGVVKVEGDRKTVQHLEGGIIEELNVRDGDTVTEGDILLVIDQTQARAELSIINGQLITAQAMVARLTAERDLKSAVSYPFININDVRIAQLIASENQQFQARLQSTSGEIKVLEQQIEQLGNQISGLKALVRSKRRLLKSYAEEIKDNKELLSQGFVNKQRLRDVERSRDRLDGEVAEHRSNINGINVQITETRLQILQVNKNFRSAVVEQLSQAQAQVFDLQERGSAISDRVKRTRVLAPTSGMVISMNVHTVGGVIAPGTPILDIVPAGDAYIVEAQISVNDIDQVGVGMPVDIRFSAFKSGTTAVINGEVALLSADSLMNETTGVPYYLARIKVTNEGSKKLGALQLLPGMPAEILINTGSRTLLEYLLQPATDAFARSMLEQ